MELNLYNYVKVALQFRETICGGVPKNSKLIEGWLNSKKPPLTDLVEKTIAEMGAELLELEERAWTGFKSDDQGLYIESRQIKAMLKESANVTGVSVAYKGGKNYITNGIFVRPAKVYLGVKEPSGFEETVCHISGPAGKRSAIKRFDVVYRPCLEFELMVLQRIQGTQILPMEVIHALFTHGQESGLGANRSQGYGTFDISIFEEKPAEPGTVAPWTGLKPPSASKPVRGAKKAADPEAETEE